MKLLIENWRKFVVDLCFTALIAIVASGCQGQLFGSFVGEDSLIDDIVDTNPSTSTAGAVTLVDTEEDPEPRITAVVSGTVTVDLYTYDENGARIVVQEDQFCDTEFPFGSIFVASYTNNGGAINIRGSDTIPQPSLDGDPYEMVITLSEAGTIQVYGSLDYHQDTIIHSYDPIGVYPDSIDIEDGDEIEDIDFSIVVEYDTNCGGGGGGGGIHDPININGPIKITQAYNGGEAIVMISDLDGRGPLYWAFTQPEETEDGGEGEYSFDVPSNYGEMNLLGAYDSNLNNLIDAGDTWGAYVSELDTEGNPIDIGEEDLNNYLIQLPIGDGTSGLAIVPFSWISGAVSTVGGSFDDLTEGSTLYVAALKYRPNTDLSVETLASTAYDYDVFYWPELTGNSSVEYNLGTPANTTLYLWAYVDEDGDGIVNESGEAIASGGGDSSGTIITDGTDIEQDIYVASPE
jgi:hypothetical protein